MGLQLSPAKMGLDRLDHVVNPEITASEGTWIWSCPKTTINCNKSHPRAVTIITIYNRNPVKMGCLEPPWLDYREKSKDMAGTGSLGAPLVRCHFDHDRIHLGSCDSSIHTRKLVKTACQSSQFASTMPYCAKCCSSGELWSTSHYEIL